MPSNSSVADVSLTTECDHCILTHGRAWAISLTQKTTINEEISDLCFPRSKDEMDERLLYRFVFFNLVSGLIPHSCFDSVGHLLE